MRDICRYPCSTPMQLSSRSSLRLTCRPPPHRLAIIAPVNLTNKAPSSKDSDPGFYDTMAKVLELKKMAGTVKLNTLEPKRFTGDICERVGFICQADVQQSGVRSGIPSDAGQDLHGHSVTCGPHACAPLVGGDLHTRGPGHHVDRCRRP